MGDSVAVTCPQVEKVVGRGMSWVIASAFTSEDIRVYVRYVGWTLKWNRVRQTHLITSRTRPEYDDAQNLFGLKQSQSQGVGGPQCTRRVLAVQSRKHPVISSSEYAMIELCVFHPSVTADRTNLAIYSWAAETSKSMLGIERKTNRRRIERLESTTSSDWIHRYALPFPPSCSSSGCCLSVLR